MSDISKMIEITGSDITRPDCTGYKVTLHIVRVGYIAKELQYGEIAAFDQAFDRMKRQLISEILEIVNRETIDKLDLMRTESYKEACTRTTFEGYKDNMDMAEKLGKLANELRGR